LYLHVNEIWELDMDIAKGSFVAKYKPVYTILGGLVLVGTIEDVHRSSCSYVLPKVIHTCPNISEPTHLKRGRTST